MKRVVLLLVSALTLAGCGGAGTAEKPASPASAARILRSGVEAARHAKAVAFDARIDLSVDGRVNDAPAGVGLVLGGPLRLDLSGKSARPQGSSGGKFDLDFTLRFAGGSFAGEALSPDGRRLFVRSDSLLGPGWRSVPMADRGEHPDMKRGDAKRGDEHDLLRGLAPGDVFSNVKVGRGGDTDSVAADLDLQRLVGAVVLVARETATPKQKRLLGQAVDAVRRAHGELSFDHATHLPSQAKAEVDVALGKELREYSHGLRGLDAKVDMRFHDWNRDFSVTAPSNAVPLGQGSRGLLPFA